MIKQILSEVTIYNKYARFLPSKNRRETWKEIVDRNKEMHIKKFPELKNSIEDAYEFVYDKKILPSMRSMQFAGKPIEISPNRIFNCAFVPADHYKVFSEIMFLLLGGTGVGYSVQKHHIDKLPPIQQLGNRSRRFLIGDSIEGWADAIDALIKSYFRGTSKIRFDFFDIRAKGAPLVTSGGRAPGPQPLKVCLLKIDGILSQKEVGTKLTSLEVHDIICYIADAVLAGGIRRAALISLFDRNDESMLNCKSGNWWEHSPQRGRANNSAVLPRNEVSKEDFISVWERTKSSGFGEPGIFWTNNKEWGCNPCCEISLMPFQFCNLTEVNVADVSTQEELNNRVKKAAFIGTLQASYTDFHYLRPIWKRNTEKEALIGVSMTGIASGKVLDLDLSLAADVVRIENTLVSNEIGISSSARTTCVKPAGTTSCVLGTSSGIHAWHNDYYIRRMELQKDEPITVYLEREIPNLIEDSIRNSQHKLLCLPIAAPEGAITRHEEAIDLLERIKSVYKSWVMSGHVSGDNLNNISATISVKDNEWEKVVEWMWNNRNYYNGLSVLPYDGGQYTQAPFEDSTKEKVEELSVYAKKINLNKVLEEEDNTDLSGEIACAGGSCELI